MLSHQSPAERVARESVRLNEPVTPVSVVTVDRHLPVRPATIAVIAAGGRFNQNDEKQQVKTATTKVYTFAA